MFKPWLKVFVLQQGADECGVFAALVARAPWVMEFPAIYQLVWNLHVRVHLREPYFDPRDHAKLPPVPMIDTVQMHEA